MTEIMPESSMDSPVTPTPPKKFLPIIVACLIVLLAVIFYVSANR